MDRKAVSFVTFALILAGIFVSVSEVQPVELRADGDMVFFDDFDDGDLSDWTVTTTGTGEFGPSSDKFESSPYSVHMKSLGDSKATGVSPTYSLDLTMDYTISFYFSIPHTDNHWFEVFNNHQIYLMIDYDDDLKYYKGEGQSELIAQLATNNWHYIMISVHPSSSSYEVYINDTLRKTCSMWIHGGWEDSFRIGDRADGSTDKGEAYWDDLYIYQHIPETIYVDDDNTSGPWNGTSGHPYQNITSGLEHAYEEDTIFVRNGTYYENIIVNKTVSLMGENRETTVIDGNETGTCVTIEVDNVTVSGFKIQWSNSSLGYYLIAAFNCSGIRVLDNHLSTANYKVLLENCTNSIVGDNYVAGGWKAITLSSSSNNSIIENFIFGCSMCTFPVGPFYGIFLENSHMNQIMNNTIATCDVGIELYESRYNEIFNNTFCDPYWENCHSYDAVALTSHSDENVLVGNLIAETVLGSLRIDESNNCLIYHNDFLSSQPYLVTPCTNHWDNGYPSGGNYWIDYEGVDMYSGIFQNESGSDGIGDTAYVLNMNNTDQYPLMTPLGYFPWDVTGDNYVGIDDIVAVASHFGQDPAHPDWNPKYDINCDDWVGIDDIVATAEHFGQSP